MSAKQIDISDSLVYEEGIPLPQWDLLLTWVDEHVPPKGYHDAWTNIARQWMMHTGKALGKHYRVFETANTILLAADSETPAETVLIFAEQCRSELLRRLNGIADFNILGKSVVLLTANQDDFYTYYSHFTPEGRQGQSGGVQIRHGYEHIAINGGFGRNAPAILAHEMVHASLSHLTMPVWIEEGLAQMYEHILAEPTPFQIDTYAANEHKRYWKTNTLTEFWRGDGFFKVGKVTGLSYQLAEVLMRLLVEEFRPRWFGFVNEPQQRFFAFLKNAMVHDCGSEAARVNLRMSLSQIAARFLGPGDWEPSL